MTLHDATNTFYLVFEPQHRRIMISQGGKLPVHMEPSRFLDAATASGIDSSGVAKAYAELLERGEATLVVKGLHGSALLSMLR